MLLGALLALLALSAAGQPRPETVTVIARVAERTLQLPAEILPYERVDVHARVTGFVETVLVDRGSRVRQGQTLMVLSAPEIAAQRAEAEARARAAASQEAEAQARVVVAESVYERLRAAAETPGAVARVELVRAEKTLEAARAARQAAGDAARAAEAAVEQWRRLEAYLTVTAPFDGVVTERLVHPGALVGPGSGRSEPLLRLEQHHRLRVLVSVPEAEAAGISEGTRVGFQVNAYPSQKFFGTVARSAHALDPRTRSLPVELDVDNSAGRLAPGMYAEVEWPVRRPQPSLLAPVTSVVTTTERTFVIRVRHGRAEWVDVRRGNVLGEWVEVFGPLRPGDVLLRRGTDEIRPGTPLDVR